MSKTSNKKQKNQNRNNNANNVIVAEITENFSFTKIRKIANTKRRVPV